MSAPADDETSSAAELAAATELAGTADAETQSAYAWGLADDDDVPTQRLTPSRITGAAVAAAGVLIAATVVVGFVYLRDRSAPTQDKLPAATPTSTVAQPPPPPPAPPPVTVTTVVVQQPPATITKQAPMPTLPTAVPGWTQQQLGALAVFDQRFIGAMRTQGWVILDPAVLTKDAHLACAQLSNGRPPAAVAQDYTAASRGMADGATFVSTAMAVYPNCP